MSVDCQKLSRNIAGSRLEAVELRKFKELGKRFLQCFVLYTYFFLNNRTIETQLWQKKDLFFVFSKKTETISIFSVSSLDF